MLVKHPTVLLGTLALVLSACSANETVVANETVSPASKHAHVGGEYIKTAKPGAAVEISHDYDGTAQVGETRLVNIRVANSYDAGRLEVSLSPNAGLTLENGSGPYVFDMAGHDVHEFSVSVKAHGQGIFYLNVTAVAKYGTHQQAARNTAISFNAGVERLKRPNEVAVVPEKTQGPAGVVSMPADEEILTSKSDE